MTQDQQTYRRAAQASLVGLFIHLLLTIALALIGLWSSSAAVHAATWHAVAGLPVWIILLLIYKQHTVERAEAMEAEQLASRDAQAAALFEEHAEDLQAARSRLDGLYRWGLNTVSVLIAVYLIAVGGALLYKNFQQVTVKQVARVVGSAETQRTAVDYVRLSPRELSEIALRPDINLTAMAFMAVGVAALAFFFARYIAGMTKVKEWQLLRGGAGYLMAMMSVAALVAATLLIGLFSTYQARIYMGYLSLVVPAVMLLLGLETLLTFLLSAYRPRKPGEVPRPAFDSRVAGLLTSPESIAKAVGDAINYQFGFEVSSSWFYQMLSRAITPLVAAGMVVLVVMSCLVIVGPHEKAVVTRFGAIVGQPLGPGLHFKLPWPISHARAYPVARVQTLLVGSLTKGFKSGAAILWTNTHSDEKEDYLVTAPTAVSESVGDVEGDSGTPGMSLIGVQVVVQYRVDDLAKYVTSADDPVKVLTALAERRVNEYFVSQDVDTLIGPGRITAGDALRRSIQADADGLPRPLGVSVIFVGLSGLHPPQEQEVAAAFLEQIGALQEKQTTVEQAQAEAIRTLAQVAGSREMALQIDQVIKEYDSLRLQLQRLRGDGAAKPEQVAELEEQVLGREVKLEELLAGASGKAAELIHAARAYRWRYALGERAKAERFVVELQAYNKAPSLYRSKMYLQVLAEHMAQPRKLLVATEHTQAPIFRIDLKDNESPLQLWEKQE